MLDTDLPASGVVPVDRARVTVQVSTFPAEGDAYTQVYDLHNGRPLADVTMSADRATLSLTFDFPAGALQAGHQYMIPLFWSSIPRGSVSGEQLLEREEPIVRFSVEGDPFYEPNPLTTPMRWLCGERDVAGRCVASLDRTELFMFRRFSIPPGATVTISGDGLEPVTVPLPEQPVAKTLPLAFLPELPRGREVLLTFTTLHDEEYGTRGPSGGGGRGGESEPADTSMKVAASIRPMQRRSSRATEKSSGIGRRPRPVAEPSSNRKAGGPRAHRWRRRVTSAGVSIRG